MEEFKKLVVALSVLSMFASVTVGFNGGFDFSATLISNTPRHVNLGDLEKLEGQVIVAVDFLFDWISDQGQ